MKLLKTVKLNSGEKIELYFIEGKKPCKNVLITGVFHGEEPQGFYVIKNYFFNKIFESKNNIYIIPCLNPDGMSDNKRKNANGVDLNRNFPTKNWEKTSPDSEYFGGNTPESEEETKFMTEIINKIKPDLILTLHSPFAVVNYDGNAQSEAEKISELTNYPVQSDIGYPTPGSFGTYCGIERNIPTITLEYDENEDMDKIYEKSDRVFDYLLKEF